MINALEYVKIKYIAFAICKYPEVTERSIIMKVRKNVAAKKDNDCYSEKYVDPVIPEGYRHIRGTYWYNGFEIERIKDGSMFTFIPVGSLKNNGTLDGKHFDEKFGRRKWYPNDSDELGEESIYGTKNILWKQLQSIKEYGGFYVSSFPISRTADRKLMSILGKNPLTMINFELAMNMSKAFECNNGVTSHLLFGAEYDSILEWFVETKAITVHEIAENILLNSHENININNIYGMGRIGEWTQERATKGTETKHAVRGISAYGSKRPLAWREANYRYIKSACIGFRVALYIP